MARLKKPEESLEAAIIEKAELLGIKVYKCSQGFRGVFDPTGQRADGGVGKYVPVRGGTRMTEGLADLELWFPTAEGWILGKFEVKTPAGLKSHERYRRLTEMEMRTQCPSAEKDWRRAIAQTDYEALCLAAGTPYGRGGLVEFDALLAALGFLRHQGEQGGNAPLFVRASRDALERLAEIRRGLVAPAEPGAHRLR